MGTALLIVLMLVILFVAFKFFKTKGNSTYNNDINFKNVLDELPDDDKSEESSINDTDNK